MLTKLSVYIGIIMYRFVIDDEGRFYYEKIGNTWVEYIGIMFFEYESEIRYVINDYHIKYYNNESDHLLSEEYYD